MALYIKSSTYFEEELGAIVRVTVRSNSRRMCARLVGTEYRVSVPSGTTVDRYRELVAAMKERLGEAARRAVSKRFEPGFELDGFMIRVVVEGDDREDRNMIEVMREKRPDGGLLLRFSVRPEANPAKYQRAINKKVLECACVIAGKFFLPEIMGAVLELGLTSRVKSVEFTTHSSTLGRCFTDGRLEFSSRLMFYPQELRRLVVMHELAHLTYGNHSKEFHALVDSYLGGRERELEKALKAFRLPLF